MSNKISQLVIAIVLLLVVLFVTLSVFTSGGNSIGQAALYLAGICFLIGMISPRGALYLLVFLCAYSDLVKRFMVLDVSVSFLDVTYILAIAPLTLAGVVVNRLVGCLLQQVPFRREDAYRFLFCSSVLGLVALSAVKRGEGMSSLRIVADYGAFVYLLFVVPMIFKSRDDLMKFGKFAIYVFLPVALYGIYQKLFGLSAFELDYLMSGLTSEARQLDDVSVRVFSTLNSATSLSIVMTACVILTFLLAHERYLKKIPAALYMLIFAFCGFATLTRTGWLCLFAFPFICFVYRFRFLTLISYLAGVTSIIVVVFSASYIMDNLHSWQGVITGDKGEVASIEAAREEQALRITTLYDRFYGFNNLKNPNNWQPFGIKRETRYGMGRFDDEAFSHDAISGFIFKRGYVPFMILVLSAATLVIVVHRRILSVKGRQRKTLAYWVAGISAMLVSLLAGRIAFQFPANVFLWYFVCVSMHLFKNVDKTYDSYETDRVSPTGSQKLMATN